MTAHCRHIPQLTDLLCENCGYTLNGLPTDSKCPECGELISDSAPELRRPSSWEASGSLGARRGVLQYDVRRALPPVAFFPTSPDAASEPLRDVVRAGPLGNRRGRLRARGDAHAEVFLLPPDNNRLLLLAGLIIGAYVLLLVTTRVAARLTAWEAAYLDCRLPMAVVMCAACTSTRRHYLPVAALGCLTVVGYVWWLSGAVGCVESAYLYTLAGEVIVCAGYLFNTYWIGMRNMLYANR